MMSYVSALTDCRTLSPAAFELMLARPAGFTFQAGQHLRLLLDGEERDYTLVSAPEAPDLALLVRLVPGGRISSCLAAINPGSPLSFTGPHGRFLFRPSDRKPLFVATGTGIAPFVAMVRSGVRGYTVLHGVREQGELYYQEVLSGDAAKFVACISGGRIREEPGHFPGRVTSFLEERLPIETYDFYLCGREEMVRDITALVDDRFPGSRVYSEVFF
jgi:ferredoxin-NADP reductase